MTSAALKTFVYRGVLPLLLIVGALLRPSLISFTYLLLAFVGPVFPPIRSSSPVQVSTRLYLILCVLVTLLASLAQFIYQIVEHSVDKGDKPYAEACKTDDVQYWLRQLGIIRIPSNAGADALFIILPDFLALVGSLAALVICTIYETDPPNQSLAASESFHTAISDGRRGSVTNRRRTRHIRFSDALVPAVKRASDIALMFFVVLVGIVQPSILNALYFVVFLVVITWWALYTPLRRPTFNAIKCFLIVYTALHFLTLYAYQIPFVQHLIEDKSFPARLIGLSALMHTDCSIYWRFEAVVGTHWTSYLNYALVLTLYYVLIIQYQWTRRGIRRFSTQDDDDSTANEELIPANDGEMPHENIRLSRMTSANMDRQKISGIFRRPGEKETLAARSLEEFLYFCLHHSYVFSLLAMMIWALLYHSVFGLIYLICACVLWALYDSRKWSFQVSPAIIVYTEFLLIVQYIYSMDLTTSELLVKTSLEIIGFRLAANRTLAFTTLCVKVGLSLPLFVLLRLHLREDFYNSLSEQDRRRRLNYGTFDAPLRSSPTVALAGNGQNVSLLKHLSKFFTKLWIFVVALVLLLNTLTAPPTLYALGYFVLWTLLIVDLHISFAFVRRTIYAFLTAVITYSSIVIVAVYCYQFKAVPGYWKDLTHLSDDWNRDLGLINFKKAGEHDELFVRLLAPISLIVVTMLQLKFFHDPWTKLVQTPTASADTSRVPSPEGHRPVHSLLRKARAYFRTLREMLWRLAEVHSARLILLLLVLIAVEHFCALNGIILVFVSLAVCLPALAIPISLLTVVYLSLVFLARRVYQMHFFPANETNYMFDRPNDYCTEINLGENQTTQSVAQWIGFKKESSVQGDVAHIVLVIVAIAVHLCIRFRQKHHRALHGLPEPPAGIIFPDADPTKFDKSIADCIKFFFNYGFYKFGLEVSLIMIVIVAWVRMDFLGAVLTLWLMLFVLLPRSACRVMWPFFLFYLAVMFPLQYAMSIGLPQALCIEYPWSDIFELADHSLSKVLNDNLMLFFDLANYRASPERFYHYLVADFFLLIIVASQEIVFRRENPGHPAGPNYSIYKSGNYVLRKDNPRYDFTTEQRSFVDFFKMVVFLYGHWITMVMVLAAGLGGTSLFALGYIVLAFWMLWQGNNLYTMKNYARTLAKWNLLAIYTVSVMFCKVSLQVLGCVFFKQMDQYCLLRQLFSIVCVNELSNVGIKFHTDTPGGGASKDSCTVTALETKIGYDAVAFAFIIFQLRVLHSWYFQHCMIDFRCEIIQANRGAVLINQLVEKEMREQNEQQRLKFQSIKERTAVIRKRYEEQRIRSKTESTAFAPNTYAQAKRAGDYYMFEYEPKNDDLVVDVDSYVPEVTPGAGDYDRLDPAQLIHTALAKDLDIPGTLHSVDVAEKIKDEELRMIAAVGSGTSRVDQASPGFAPSTVSTTTAIEPTLVEEPTQVDEEEEEADQGCADTVLNYLHFGWRIFLSLVDWVAAFLNRHSREHRYVAYVLNKEKERLKSILYNDLYDAGKSMSELRQQWENHNLHMVSSEADITRLEYEVHDSWQQRNVFSRITTAIGNAIAAHTDIICFFLAAIAHGTSTGLITLPLPLLVFFWGSLANPRPAKIFWITLIAYTELIVILKFIFQFDSWSWNSDAAQIANANNPYRLEYLFGVQKQDLYAVWDVTLLIALFFHRYMLRRLGLWKDATNLDTFEATNITRQPAGSVDVEQIQLSDTLASTPTSQQVESSLNTTGASESKPKGALGDFCDKLFHPKFRYVRDFYPLMFFLDLICFFIITFGFPHFGEGGTGMIVRDIQANRVPITFVAMLLIISIMVVIDRALYLRKAVKAKLIYQLVTVVFLHVWIFYVLPYVTKQKAAENNIAKFLYIVKCIYFLVSAWQIRNGYPSLCIGNLLTHSYGLVNMVLFKIWLLIPFMFEIRTAIDWTWTETSMPLFDFFNMENFYATIYNLKCARTFEQNFPAPRGVAKGSVVKYLMGLPMIFFLILIIWCPLLAFSLLNRIGVQLLPESVKLRASIEGYPPLYTMEAMGIYIEPLTAAEMDALKTGVSNALVVPDGRAAVAFIEDYSADDIRKVKFRPEGELYWSITPQSLAALKYDLENMKETDELKFSINIQFQRAREDKKKEPQIHSTEFSQQITRNSSTRLEFLNALNTQTGSSQKVTVPILLPVYLIVPNEGEVQVAKNIHKVVKSNMEKELEHKTGQEEIKLDKPVTYSNVTMVFDRTANDRAQWILQEDLQPHTKNVTSFVLDPVEYSASGLKYLEVVAFVDRVFPSFISSFVQGGIIAMYVAVVLLVGRLIRSVVMNAPLDVQISEIPNPDLLLKICLDIYLVREAHDFVLEQDLFAKMIFLFRSPATLIKWTRYKVKNE